MKKAEVKVGQIYWAKISGRSVKARIESVKANGWAATNLNSGRKATIKSAINLDEIIEGRNVHSDRRLKKQQEQERVKQLRAEAQEKTTDIQSAIATKIETFKEENIKTNQEATKVVKRTITKSPEVKIAWAKNIAQLIEQSSIKEVAERVGKSTTYVARTYRAYTQVYLANEDIQIAFDTKLIGWTKLHKLAEKKITSDRLEEFVSSINQK